MPNVPQLIIAYTHGQDIGTNQMKISIMAVSLDVRVSVEVMLPASHAVTRKLEIPMIQIA